MQIATMKSNDPTTQTQRINRNHNSNQSIIFNNNQSTVGNCKTIESNEPHLNNANKIFLTKPIPKFA